MPSSISTDISTMWFRDRIWSVRCGGMAADVRSETVPVTLRKLRARLGAFGRHMVITERGVGWRLTRPSRPLAAPLPRFDSPSIDRPGLREHLDSLWSHGWRCISVCGPSGSGSSRAAIEAARRWHGDAAVFVSLSACPDVEAARIALGRSVGSLDGTLDAVVAALAERPTLFVMDDAHVHLDEVRSWAAALRGHRFLVAGRVALGFPDEAVVAVPPLEGAVGRAFVRSRLMAARWGHTADDATLDDLLEAVDGLPLAIEVLAASPESPAEQLCLLNDDVSSATAPVDRILHRSLQGLPPRLLDLLGALSVPSAALHRAEICGWLGDSAMEDVLELAKRSLVVRVGGGWRPLVSLRRILLRKSFPEHRASYTAWLSEWVRGAEAAFFARGDDVADRAAALGDDLLQLMEQADPELASEVAWLCYATACHRGPIAVFRSAQAILSRRGLETPLSTALEAVACGDVVVAPAEMKEAVRLETARSLSWLPQRPRPSFEAPEVMDSCTRGLAMRRQFTERVRTGEEPYAVWHTLRPQIADWAVVQLHLDISLARSLHVLGRHAEARTCWRSLDTELQRSRLFSLRLVARHGLAEAAAWLDADDVAEAAALDAHRASVEAGWAHTWVAARPGMFLLLRGLPTLAASMLEHGLWSPHEEARMASRRLLHAIAVSESGPSAEPHPPDTWRCQMADGTSLGEVVDVATSLARLRWRERGGEDVDAERRQRVQGLRGILGLANRNAR